MLTSAQMLSFLQWLVNQATALATQMNLVTVAPALTAIQALLSSGSTITTGVIDLLTAMLNDVAGYLVTILTSWLPKLLVIAGPAVLAPKAV